MAAGVGLALPICSLEEVFTPGTSKLSFLKEHLPPSLYSQNTYLNTLVFLPPDLFASLLRSSWFIRKLSWPGHSHSWNSFTGKRRGNKLEGRFQIVLHAPLSFLGCPLPTHAGGSLPLLNLVFTLPSLSSWASRLLCLHSQVSVYPFPDSSQLMDTVVNLCCYPPCIPLLRI